MNIWKQAPLVRIILSFITGILSGFYLILPECLLIIFTSCFIVLASIASSIVYAKGKYAYRWTYGILIHLSVISISWLLAELNTEDRNKDHFANNQHVDGLMAVVNQEPREKGKNLRFEIITKAIRNDQGWVSASGRCLIYIRSDSNQDIPSYGDLIVLYATPFEIPPVHNPGQFDFKNWLGNQQIYHQVFLQSGQWKILSHHSGNSLTSTAISLRKKLLDVFRSAGLDGQEYAVLSALILGFEDDILPETMQAYAAAGALHILSVSGMHVGLIYGVLLVILRWMDRLKRGKIIRALLILLFLWFYSLLTGFSPSVLRSAMMLSFIVLGNTLERTSNMYNTLAASAIALFAVFSPFLIRQVGFQLSYCAVGGIVFLYQPLYRLITFNSWLGEQIWSIIAVSLAAQLATFPMSLFYFHQFPNYFLPANLIVIPLSTLVIFSGLTLFLLLPVPFLLVKVGWLVSKEVSCLNGSVQWIQNLPYSLSQDIFISFPEMFLMYGIIFWLALFFLNRNRAFVFPFMVFLIFYLFSRLILIDERNQQTECLVFDVPGHTCLSFIDGNTCALLLDSGLINNPSKIKSIAGVYLLQKGINPQDCEFISSDSAIENYRSQNALSIRKAWVRFNHMNMLMIGPGFRIPDHPSGIHFNAVFIHGNPRSPMDSLFSKISFDTLFADASNSRYKIKSWKSAATKVGKPFVYTQEAGSWSWNRNN